MPCPRHGLPFYNRAVRIPVFILPFVSVSVWVVMKLPKFRPLDRSRYMPCPIFYILEEIVFLVLLLLRNGDVDDFDPSIFDGSLYVGSRQYYFHCLPAFDDGFVDCSQRQGIVGKIPSAAFAYFSFCVPIAVFK